jgi:ATP-dependent exoDNAse (exonuclease V) beta subunit
LQVVTATEHAATIRAEIEPAAQPGEQFDLFAEPRAARRLPDVKVESVGIDFSRPHGKRFGTLVHAVLSIVDLKADKNGVQLVADLEGRLLGATAEEITAATKTVSRALAHPLMKRAASAWFAGRCRRETPVVIKLEDGVLVEGIVDLAFRDESDPDTWIVVDFKTDFEMGERLEEYRNQVALYAEAIARATGLQSRGVLLRL